MSISEIEGLIAMPQIVCPSCGTHMRLSTIQPQALDDNRETITFVCECGFEYKQSSAVGAERAL